MNTFELNSPSNSQTVTTRRQHVWFIALISIAIVCLIGPTEWRVASAQSTLATERDKPPEIKTTEQVFKNIQVFKGLPASQLDSTMAFISGSLGVKCTYCHVNPWDKDDKAEKQAARRMIRMVFDLNKANFGAGPAVTCFTCHRGHPRPVSVPVTGQNLWAPTAPASKETPLPTVDQILDKYLQALGGTAALQKVTSRVVKGSRIGADGVLVPEDVFQKAPNKMLTVTSYPDVVFRNGFNGLLPWGYSSRDGLRDLPPQVAADMKREAEFYREMRMKDLYSKLTMMSKETIANTEAYVIEAIPLSGKAERLYFDATTGLLIRRYTMFDTFLGKLPLQIDFEDYREIDGVKQPFLIHWSMPGRVWGRKITEIKQNVQVDDSQFEPPAKPGMN